MNKSILDRLMDWVGNWKKLLKKTFNLMLQILNSQSYKSPTCESCEYHISQWWKFTQ